MFGAGAVITSLRRLLLIGSLNGMYLTTTTCVLSVSATGPAAATAVVPEACSAIGRHALGALSPLLL